MKLYEATNGYMGYGAVHCNVFAHDEEEALEMARESFKEESGIHGESYYKDINLCLLLDTEEDKEPFVTDIYD